MYLVFFLGICVVFHLRYEIDLSKISEISVSSRRHTLYFAILIITVDWVELEGFLKLCYFVKDRLLFIFYR